MFFYKHVAGAEWEEVGMLGSRQGLGAKLNGLRLIITLLQDVFDPKYVSSIFNWRATIQEWNVNIPPALHTPRWATHGTPLYGVHSCKLTLGTP